MTMDSDDDRYLNLILTPLHVCAHYRPKFGQGTKGERIEPASHDFGREVGDNFCPYCEFTFENPLPRSRKCPSCRKDIVRTSTLDQRKVLLTKSEAAEYEIFANNEKIRIASKPKGLTLTQFQTLYQGDAFYNWFGLDNSLMYAAHKAGGGMTSVYRQIGIGCEALFRTILQDTLGLSRQDVRWSYQVPAPRGGMRTLTLDGRVPLEAVQDATARQRFHDWMRKAADGLGVAEQIFNTLTGTIFEVRQGYKSKDSKRQNADIANAATAYTSAYLG
jgi:hypothetical protein